MGALHAAAVVVSLRDRKALHPVKALSFIVLAAVWSAATPFLGLWSAMLLSFVEKFVPDGSFTFYFMMACGSAIGSAGYWLLVRFFWLKSLRLIDLLRTMALCVAATLLSVVALGLLKLNGEFIVVGLTVAWWFAFSLSLYWSERSWCFRKSRIAAETSP